MKFCPRCKSVMVPIRSRRRYYLICSRCGYKIIMKKKHLYKYYVFTTELRYRIFTSRPITRKNEMKNTDILEILREETREIRDNILIREWY